jgi:hypothetical protein
MRRVTVFTFGQYVLVRPNMLKGIRRDARPAMKNQPAVERRFSTERLTVLVVSPVEEDHLSLEAIVRHPTYSTWMLFN